LVFCRVGGFDAARVNKAWTGLKARRVSEQRVGLERRSAGAMGRCRALFQEHLSRGCLFAVVSLPGPGLPSQGTPAAGVRDGPHADAGAFVRAKVGAVKPA